MYRSIYLVLAVFGSVLVIVLILVGRDLQKAARTGPGWKRRLVATGLALLGAVGMTSGCGQGPGANGGTAASSKLAATAGQRLEETKPWNHLTAVWREAEEIGSGKRGDYPFDERGKAQILGELVTAAGNLDEMKDAALLTSTEAELLKKELARLTAGVRAKLPTEMRNATCYAPMEFMPCQESFSRLTDRLPLLEKLASSERLQPQVVSKVLGTIEEDIALLEKKEARDTLPASQRMEAEKACAAAKSYVQKIKSALQAEATELASDERWRAVVDAWKMAVPLAESGRSTTAERKTVDARLEAAKRGVAEMATVGSLSKAESELLLSEADRLQKRIYRDPPTDCQVTCYDMGYLPAGQESLQRLSLRVPLLKQLAAGGKLHPAALDKTLGSIEADIQVLSNEADLKQMQPKDRDQAQMLPRMPKRRWPKSSES